MDLTQFKSSIFTSSILTRIFPVALKKMQSLAIAVEVIVFFIIDDDYYLVCINAKIFFTDIICMFVIDRLL